MQASAVQVDTATSTLRQVVDEKRVVDLPLSGRNAATLLTLVPGVTPAPASGANQGQGITFQEVSINSTNGSRQNQINFQLDGANNVDNYTNLNMLFPFPDALQEFSVRTSNYSAAYGENAGGNVNIVTKSGTNSLHGDGFEFIRNRVFNARNFFAADRDPLKRNQFGGTIGGPVDSPHVCNGKDRTFFIGAATTGAAELMRWQDRVGSNEPGRFADVIAVAGAPLEDVTRLQHVLFAMKGGVVLKNGFSD